MPELGLPQGLVAIALNKGCQVLIFAISLYLLFQLLN